MRLSVLQDEAYRIADEHGFHEADREATFGEQLALIHSELSEALEAFRVRGDTVGYIEDGKPEGVPFELADAVIRIADTCHQFGISLEGAVVTKMRFNETRPYRHGGKRL